MSRRSDLAAGAAHFFIFNYLWQFNGFMYCQPVADGFTTCVALALSARLFKRLKVPNAGEPAWATN
jgi:hypothetical protein